jgi:hypothetical protein
MARSLPHGLLKGTTQARVPLSPDPRAWTCFSFLFKGTNNLSFTSFYFVSFKIQRQRVAPKANNVSSPNLDSGHHYGG